MFLFKTLKTSIQKVLLFLLLMASLGTASERQPEIQKTAFDAIKNNEVEVIRSLLIEGLDPNYKLGEPQNSMFIAVVYDRPEILQELLHAGGNVDHKLEGRMYFATYLAQKNNLQLLKLVLAQKPDLNKLMYVNQFTAFTGMLRFINEGTLKYVLNNSNVDVNFRPQNGLSSLYLAYERGKCGFRCVELLLEHGANPCLEIRSNKKSFLSYLEDSKSTNLIENIKEYKCDKDV